MSNTYPTEAYKILLVDDDPNILQALNRLLKHYQVEMFTSGEEALVAAHETTFDIVISDYKMPEMDGVAFLTFFRALQPDAIRMILTGYADLNTAQHAINDVEVFRFISKPWNNFELLNGVKRGLEYRRVMLENRALADEVRKQRVILNQQEAILMALEKEEPGITKVNWGIDGSIIIDSADLKLDEP